jgi:hypothetical protein
LLQDLWDVIKQFRNIFERVRDLVSKEDFYNIYRPLLGGFYPEGLTLQGVEVNGQQPAVLAAKGPSAGQSTMIILFDLMLGVSHHGSAKDFQEEMLTYMVTPHAQMVKDFRTRIASSGYVRTSVIEFNSACYLFTFC